MVPVYKMFIICKEKTDAYTRPFSLSSISQIWSISSTECISSANSHMTACAAPELDKNLSFASASFFNISCKLEYRIIFTR